MKETAFSRQEFKFLLGIGSALALRQLGLIMVMPFLAIYGKSLTSSTPGLIGLSLGIYGLSQAVFQVPFGHLSDIWGRKPIILFGLMLFIFGLVLAFWAKSIYLFILARILQGSGAIMAVAYAWVGDNIGGQHRNKGMSIIGMLVGVSATFAFIGGPVLHQWLSVPQLFLICAAMAFAAWLYILFFLKGEDKHQYSDQPFHFHYKELMKNTNLLKLFTAGFITNYLLVSQFYIVPQLLEKSLGVDGLWKVFVPATILAVFVMRLAAKSADRGYFRQIAVLSFAIILLGCFSYFTSHPIWIGFGTALFMIGYMCLITLLPASVTKLSRKSYRGAVTGVFNTFQFIGSFLGGSLTGLLWGKHMSLAVIVLLIVSSAGLLISKNLELQTGVDESEIE